MSTKIRHLAIVSSDTDRLLDFYGAVFGMTRYSGQHTTDGYVGLNVNRRAPGRQGGFDHFGVEVDDVEQIAARVKDDYPMIELLKRPSNRPFAAISMHDPAGNVFDLSQRGLENRGGAYKDQLGEDRLHPRHVQHFMVRAVNVPPLATFYQDVFGLRKLEAAPDDPNVYLTDGIVTLVLAPWKISSYAGSGIERPQPDHIGFQVESLEAFQEDLQRLATDHPELAPKQIAGGPEREARLKLLASCKYGALHFADPDGVLIDVSERLK